MKRLFVVLMCVAAVAAPRAQQQSSTDQQGPTFRTGVDLVTIDVGVVDAKGKPVDDLRPADFAVKIDGVARQVVSAELVRIDVEAAKKQAAVEASETFFTSNLTPPSGRQIVIAIDQVSIKPGSIKTLMMTAQKFVDRLSPLDQVAFVAYPEPGPRVSFTSDHLRIKLAMERLIGHEPNNATTRLNIGVTEAMAIYEKRDQITMAEVRQRECQGIRSAQALEQCERDIVQDAALIAQRVRENSERSMNGLRQLLRELSVVDGNKALILVSEGMTDTDANDLDGVARLAAVARVSLNILVVDQSRGDATVGERPPSEFDDRRLQVQGLQSLAFASRGAVFHVAGTGEGIFERLLSEMSAYYLLGVEQRPGDAKDDRHRVDVEVRRRGVSIRSRQAFVLSSAAKPKMSSEEGLRTALLSPFPVAELPLRATTFAQQDAGGKVRLMVAADIGQPGAAPAPVNLAYILVNDENRIVASFSDKPTLSRAGNLETEALQFLGAVSVDPGIYVLRMAVVDAAGRRGSISREVSAWKMAEEELAVGDLIVGNAPTTGQMLVAAVEPHVTTENLAAYVELYSTSAATVDSATVAFDVADDADGPALTTMTARMVPGRQSNWRIAQGFVAATALPPGRYVARAKVTRDGKSVGVLARPFVLERTTTAGAILSTIASPASLIGSLPKFDREAILTREFLTPMLDAVEKRSPSLKDAMVEARAGRYGPAALEALTAGDQPAAAFLRGVDLFVKGQLNEAVTQLQLAAGPRRDFFPAAFYLGACFAAAGRDRDAAGVWQLALGNEPRPAQVYAMAADARLRDGQPASAVDILRPAFERSPNDDDLARRLGIAYMMTGKFAEAMPVLDAYLSRHATDQDALVLAIAAQYEAVRGGQTMSSEDRARMRRYASAYKGPQSALIAKYLEVMNAR